MTSHAEDEENNRASTKEFLSEARHAERLEENFARVGHTVNARIGHFELTDHVACVSGHDTETDDEEDAWDQTDCCEHTRKRQDTERYGLCDHDHARLPPGKGFEVDITVFDFACERIL